MPRYDTVLLDADETLFDFHAAEHLALCQVTAAFGFPLTQEAERFYVENNRMLWRRFDQGEITQAALGTERFARLLIHLCGDAARGAEMNAAYEEALGQFGILLPGAEALCRRLAQQCRLYIVTNGMTRSQTGRLARSPIREYISRMFVSQAMGCRKPERAFFDRVFSELSLTPEQQKRTVLVGDNLGSDILGGINAGLDTIWFHPAGDEAPETIRPTWIAASLRQVGDMILGE